MDHHVHRAVQKILEGFDVLQPEIEYLFRREAFIHSNRDVHKRSAVRNLL